MGERNAIKASSEHCGIVPEKESWSWLDHGSIIATAYYGVLFGYNNFKIVFASSACAKICAVQTRDGAEKNHEPT
jgi:hypothetical protein